MYQKVREYIKNQQMLTSEDRVIVGVSGGADSVCLLFVLSELKKELGFEMIAVHVHHGIRGETADADEAYVHKICEDTRTELVAFHKDVGKYAKNRGMSVEEAGRQVRRECFRKVFDENKGTRIALAHHRNDNAETVLWNLCRGSGLTGMGGILPKKGIWIRPLLCLDRSEIESYLKNRGISYCTDETNLENDYTRNKIRNQVIPFLEREVNAKTVEHINQCAEQLRMYGSYIADETRRYMKMCTEPKGEGELLLKKQEFQQVPEALKKGILYESICTVCGKRKDIEMTHVELAADFLDHQVGQKLSLPYNTEAVRCYAGIQFRVRKKEKIEDAKKPEEMCRMHIFEKCREMETIPQKVYTKWFDYDIIKNTVKIRHREPGDYIVINKNGDKQKLKQYFINEKIPVEERDRIWLAADGREILWIIGYRQSQAYQITEETRKILEIDFYGGKDNGRES